MENSNIEWCDHTANFWSGCTKVSPACQHCYAETLAKRFKTFGKWGRGAPRQWHGKNAIKNLLKWNRQNDAGHVFGRPDMQNQFRRTRVFINSLSDWLDDEVPIQWLADLLETIRLCPNLDFLLLTKRPENFQPRLQSILQASLAIHQSHNSHLSYLSSWLDGTPPPNVWIGTTVENQDMADKRIKPLLNIPARVRFLSCEPLLGPVNLLSSMGNLTSSQIPDGPNRGWLGLHWIICGGESGPHARPMHPDWARSLRDQAAASNIPFLFKQWGEWLPICMDPPDWKPTPDCEDWHKGRESTVLQRDGRIERSFPEGAMTCIRIGKKAAGRLLDDIEHTAFPPPPEN